jgi:hypothetical protein
MSELQILIDPMVLGVSGQAVEPLDDFRLHLFPKELNAHGCAVKTITRSDRPTRQQVQMDVEIPPEERFDILPMPGLLWESHLIPDEITRWCDLDHRQLIMLLRFEVGQ